MNKSLDVILERLIDLCHGNIWWSYQTKEKNPAIAEATQAIKNLIQVEINKARLDEVEMVKNNTLSTDLAWGYLGRRIKELKSKEGSKWVHKKS